MAMDCINSAFFTHPCTQNPFQCMPYIHQNTLYPDAADCCARVKPFTLSSLKSTPKNGPCLHQKGEIHKLSVGKQKSKKHSTNRKAL